MIAFKSFFLFSKVKSLLSCTLQSFQWILNLFLSLPGIFSKIRMYFFLICIIWRTLQGGVNFFHKCHDNHCMDFSLTNKKKFSFVQFFFKEIQCIKFTYAFYSIIANISITWCAPREGYWSDFARVRVRSMWEYIFVLLKLCIFASSLNDLLNVHAYWCKL